QGALTEASNVPDERQRLPGSRERRALLRRLRTGPITNVIALLGHRSKDVALAVAPGMNQQIQRLAVAELDPRSDGGGIVDAERPAAVDIHDVHFDHREAVRGAEGAIEKFRRKLVEAVAAPVVGDRRRHEAPAGP